MREEAITGSGSGEVWALIPARSGSKAVRDKNLQRIDGHTLLAWSVMAAKRSHGIDRVFVSTDSEDYLGEASRYGAETPFLRPAEFATDEATDLDVFGHFLGWCAEAGESIPRALVHLRPTTPMRDPQVIDRAIAFALQERWQASAVRSVHEAPESPFKWFLTEPAGFLTCLDGNRSLDLANAARQGFPKVYVPNGYVDIIFPDEVIKRGRLHGDFVMGFETDVAMEVDSWSDLEMLRAVWRVNDNLEPTIEGTG